MSGLLGFLRAAIAPTADAVAGLDAGQQAQQDRNRAIAMQNAELQRQGTLDQLRASVDASTINRNNAQADRYDRMQTTGTPDTYDAVNNAADGTLYLRNRRDPSDIQQAVDPSTGQPIKLRQPAGPSQAPHTINTSKGIMQWDPQTQTYKPTGFQAPPRATRSAGAGGETPSQQRLAVKTAYDEALKELPRPSKVQPTVLGTDPKTGRVTMVPNPDFAEAKTDSVNYERNTLDPLRKQLYDVTVPGVIPDGDNTGSGARARRAGTASAAATPAKPQLSDAQRTQMQQAYDLAAQQYKSIVDNADAPPEVKEQAQKAYNARVASIAKQYGTSAGTP